MAAALSRALADVLERLDDPAVDDEARAAVRDLTERLEAAIDARAAD
jgi:hypothetical protein